MKGRTIKQTMTNDPKVKNRMRIFKNAHRMIFNAIATEKYGRAADISRRLGVNKRFKEKQCLKKSARKK